MQSEKPYILIEQLNGLISQVQPDSIISRVFCKSEYLQATMFRLDAGQGLSEHTSSFPAVIHCLEGSARVTLEGDIHVVQAGSWIYMPPNLPHAIYAESPLSMLLLLLEKNG